MYIEHLAIWCVDLERMKDFYVRYLGAVANGKYHNPNKQFSSYFLQFEHGPRLELMQMPGILYNAAGKVQQYTGLAHFAISVGTIGKVNELTELFRAHGYSIAGEPRHTGDGYYESIVLDPEGNKIEITV